MQTKRLISLLVAFSVAPLIAQAQPACPTGEALKSQAEQADGNYSRADFNVQAGYASSPLSRKSRALAYLMYANTSSDADYEKLPIMMAPGMPCHADDCPSGIALSPEERKAYKAVSSSIVNAYVKGTPKLSWAPVLKKIPTADRLEWARKQLGCQASVTGGNTTSTAIYSAPMVSSPAPAPQPSRRVERVYGDWAYGQGYYCRNNEFQTDGYAMANARKACRDLGGSDGGTVVSQGGYNAYKANAEQCYQARAYTDCVFD
ncbi:hypothetical protein [Hyphomonas sp.]|uniref:hypothetical protein n=1 Tax=Hyphomonas sp. TaxID=87 RepID=UPI003528B6E0